VVTTSATVGMREYCMFADVIANRYGGILLSISCKLISGNGATYCGWSTDVPRGIEQAWWEKKEEMGFYTYGKQEKP
jgi:hypothetical protein